MRTAIIIILLIAGCTPSQHENATVQSEQQESEILSAASGDDVDPAWLRAQPLLTLPWTITRENFGCNYYEVAEEVGVLGDTSSYFLLVSVRTLSPGTQQLRFSTFDKDGTWLAEHTRLEFCVLQVDPDVAIDDESECPLELTFDYSISISTDLHIGYQETQLRERCERWSKDTYTASGQFIDGIVSEFSAKTLSEDDSTSTAN